MARSLAAYLVACTDGFARFNTPRQSRAMPVSHPFERSTGSSVRGRAQVSHQADKSLKTLLHMSALVSVREPGELRQYFERKHAKASRSQWSMQCATSSCIACAL
ncbi:MAG: transposase [Flavobacteriales bacterium]|nr:transposase [Flavobacteriales bacterium]